MEAEAAQLRGPVVLFVVKELCHQLPKTAGHSVQVLAAGSLIGSKPVQTAADGSTLTGVPLLCLPAAAFQRLFVAQRQKIPVILPSRADDPKVKLNAIALCSFLKDQK